MIKGYLRKIIPFSSVDGPGNRTAIFLQGCNFNCLYCHNPETIEIITKGKHIEGVREVTSQDVIDEALKYKDFIQGVTISGGECSVQFEFLLELCEKFRQAGIEVFIDTNGYMSDERFQQLADVADMFMFDLKSIDHEEHTMLTARSNEPVLHNLKRAGELGKLYEIRTVIVPQFLDNHRNIGGISQLIASIDPHIRYKIIKFRNHGVRETLKEYPPPNDEYMSEMENIAQENRLQQVIVV